MYQIPLVLLFVSLFYFRALLSISIGLMAIASIYLIVKGESHFNQAHNGQKWTMGLLTILFLLVILQVFQLGPTTFWLNQLMMKLPIVIIPLYLLTTGITIPKSEEAFTVLFAVVVLTAIVSVVNYWMNFAHYNALLLESKHIPIIGGSHHIYFGIFMTLCFWLGVYYSYFGRFRVFWLVGCVVLTLCMHILVSRTGLLAFYLSGFAFFAWFIWHFRMEKRVLWLAVLALSLPIIAFQVSGSLRNKIANSYEDFEAVRSGEDINYKSLAMRVEAWKTTTDVIRKNTWLGVGSEAFEHEMQNQYEVNESPLYPENRIGPHNQFLESGAKYGIIAILVLLALFIVSIKHWHGNPFLMLITVVFLFVFLIESLLERQLGMIAFTLFFMLAFSARGLEKRRKT